MGKKLENVGPHKHVTISDRRDVNNRFMVTCDECETCAHAFDLEQAIANLGKTSCSPDCANCYSLRHSFSEETAVPANGALYDQLHVCPFDGNKWWQSNDYYHHWQQVTSDEEWKHLQETYGSGPVQKPNLKPGSIKTGTLFLYGGPEEHLAVACFVTGMTIDEISVKEDNLVSVKGTISCIDYTEHGIRFENPWTTGFIKLETEKSFTVPACIGVIPVKDGECPFADGDGNPVFTMNSDVNDAMENFIMEQTVFYLNFTDVNDPKEMVCGPTKYKGETVEYTGKCVCDQISIMEKEEPFPWEKLINSEKYPKHCFACSCGRKWYQGNPSDDIWVEVGDEKTWQTIMEYNGELVRAVGVIEDKLYLQEVIVQELGLIPIG